MKASGRFFSMKLSELGIGKHAVIDRVPSGESSLTRLREFGVLPGTRVTLVRKAPMGDPIEISVRGSLLSMRSQEAELIEIREA